MKSIKITLFSLMILCIGVRANAQESDTTEKLTSPFQFSFFYPLGTLGINSYQYTNEFSLNMLVGVSGGLDGVELSGWGAVTWGDVRGVQIAGLFNAGKGNVEGVQLAGISNSVLGNVTGAQVSGIVNFTLKDVSGAQISGIVNSSIGNVEGAQVSGTVNSCIGNLEGAQVSGITNFAMRVSDGVQVSGFANIVPGKMNGVQVSGGLNFARHMNGFQIGVVNIADTLENGIPIGFLSFVRRGGYNHLEISTNTVLAANANLKLGVKRFYNIFGFGLNPTQDHLISGITYGVGTAMDLTGNLGLNVDLTVSTLSDIEKWEKEQDFNALSRLSVNASYEFAKHFAVFAGGAVNFLVHDSNADVLAGSYNYTWDHTSTTYRMGFGFNAGLRF